MNLFIKDIRKNLNGENLTVNKVIQYLHKYKSYKECKKWIIKLKLI